MNSVIELKTIIQSLNDKITDSDIKAFDSELSRIWQHYETTPSIIILLKMLRALGKYLDSKREKADKEALIMLNSIVRNLEKIIEMPYFDSEKTNTIVNEQIIEYKSFQNKIIAKPNITAEDMDSLKAVILAIDWEITEVTLQNFDSVLTQLMSNLKNYKIHYTFLKIIHTTGRFIGIQKANAPADSISFLRSVFEHLQEIVQTSDMPITDKKHLLENDIKRFQEFKQSVSNQKKASGKPSETVDDEPEMMPALSHVNPSVVKSDDAFNSLTELPDDGDVVPALANKKAASNIPQRDVMDDLFSMKESPADELLDAIHLMEVHGKNGQDQAMKMLDQSDGQPGLKNFTPIKKDTTPIPEIGSRLDEFFSLDAPSQPTEQNDVFSETDLDRIDVSEDQAANEKADSIIPFDNEDESFDESLQIGDADKLLNQLKFAVETKKWLQDKNDLSEMNKDIQDLQIVFKDDSQKKILLDIIYMTVNSSSTSSRKDEVSEDDLSLGKQEKTSDPSTDASSGAWAKLKSMFK